MGVIEPFGVFFIRGSINTWGSKEQSRAANSSGATEAEQQIEGDDEPAIHLVQASRGGGFRVHNIFCPRWDWKYANWFDLLQLIALLLIYSTVFVLRILYIINIIAALELILQKTEKMYRKSSVIVGVFEPSTLSNPMPHRKRFRCAQLAGQTVHCRGTRER